MPSKRDTCHLANALRLEHGVVDFWKYFDFWHRTVHTTQHEVFIRRYDSIVRLLRTNEELPCWEMFQKWGQEAGYSASAARFRIRFPSFFFWWLYRGPSRLQTPASVPISIFNFQSSLDSIVSNVNVNCKVNVLLNAENTIHAENTIAWLVIYTP